LDLFFQKGLAALSKGVLQKNEESNSCRKFLGMQIWLCSFLARNSSKEAPELSRKGPKFPS
jgi:hypothetical protein